MAREPANIDKGWQSLQKKAATADHVDPPAGLPNGLPNGLADGPADGLANELAAWQWPPIPGFRIVGEIATGGLAVIYRAVQKSLQRPVAIKALRSDVKSQPGEPDWRDRFVREARILALLRHPNLVQVHDLIGDAGDADGPLYIVMELCEGTDLLDVLSARSMLPADVAAIIALGAARGLAHLHAHGLVHRDVKPANLLLTQLGEVKLIDLGTAWDPMNPRDLRGQEIGLGTPSYMSPEQALGAPLDGRSDVFALGSVLYQMLSGQKPFAPEPATAKPDATSILRRIVHVEPAAVRSLNPAVPRRLAKIVARCLQKSPTKRYASTAELALALQDFVKDRTDHSADYSADHPADHPAADRRLLQFLVAQRLLPGAGQGVGLAPTLPGAASRQSRSSLLRRALMRLFGRGPLPPIGASLC